MSTKLSVCAYAAIVDFTLFYLSILGNFFQCIKFLIIENYKAMIMTFNFKVINIQKNFDEACSFSLINLTINDQTSTSFDSSTIQTISSDTPLLITTQEVTNIILSNLKIKNLISINNCK